jgi:hypothetical protein
MSKKPTLDFVAVSGGLPQAALARGVATDDPLERAGMAISALVTRQAQERKKLGLGRAP